MTTQMLQGQLVHRTEPARGFSLKLEFNLGLIVVVYVILGLTYSVISPIFEAPDESFHFFVIQHLHETGQLPVQDLAARTLYEQEGSQPPLYYLAGALLIAGVDTQAASANLRANPFANIGEPGRPNNKNRYIHTALESWPYRDTALAVHLVRWLSLSLGLMTLIATAALARQLFPERRSVALLAAALIAFNPQFIYLSASVNNDNALNALATVALYYLARVWRGERSWRVVVPLAVVVGLAILAKLGGLILLGFSLAIIGYLALRDRAWRWGWRTGMLVIAVAVVLSGWWFVRNVQLYGDLTGTDLMIKMLGGARTDVTLAKMVSELPSLWFSAWGVFGWFNSQLPDWAFSLYTLLVGSALAGGGLTVIQTWRGRRRITRRQVEAVGGLVVWAGLVFAGILRWEVVVPAFQARLLFSAISALAILLALGLAYWLDRGPVWGLSGLGMLMFIVAAWTPFGVIAPAYAQPRIIAQNEIPAAVNQINVDFDRTVRLIGGYAEPQIVQANDLVTIHLYWQALRQPDRDYVLAVRLLGRGLERVGGDDMYPGAGSYPTDLWPAGDILADTMLLRVEPAGQAPTRLQVEVSLREWQSDQPVSITTDDGGNWTELVVVDELQLVSDAFVAAPAQSTRYRIGDSIELIGYDPPLLGANPSVITCRLYWRAVNTPPEDYALFVHLLDANGILIGQGDSQPFDGDYPTSIWRAGETFVEERSVALTADGLPQNAVLAIGLYRPADGTRLPIVDAAGQRLRDDQMVLPVK